MAQIVMVLLWSPWQSELPSACRHRLWATLIF
jgi:hypothetical protein